MNAIKHVVRFSLVAAGLALAFSASAQTVLKFSHTDQQQGARQAGAQIFAKKVAEYTQNRYKVNVFCCGQLGNDPKNIEQLVAGASVAHRVKQPGRLRAAEAVHLAVEALVQRLRKPLLGAHFVASFVNRTSFTMNRP